MTAPINRLIDAAVHCSACGTKGVGNCRCWEKCAHGYRCETKGECECTERCSCGWYHYPGIPCFNPATARCSSRRQFGKYDHRTKRYQ